MGLPVVVGSSYHPSFLGLGDRFFGAAKSEACFCSYLSKDKAVLVLGNNVNLTFRAAVVGLQNAKAPFFEEILG